MKNVKVLKNDESVSKIAILLKGCLIALSFCLIAILVFAFVLRYISLSDSMISPINQVIKTFSIMIGVFIALKKCKKGGLILGMLIGVCFAIVAFLTFSLLCGDVLFSTTVINDCLFNGITGGICGIISVNFKK